MRRERFVLGEHLVLPFDSLKRPLDRERVGVEADVTPSKADGFALPKTASQSDGEQSLQSVVLDCGEHLPGGSGGERSDFGLWNLRRLGEAGDVPTDKAVTHREVEAISQDSSAVCDGARRWPLLGHPGHHAFHVLGSQLGQGHAPYLRRDVEPRQL